MFFRLFIARTNFSPILTKEIELNREIQVTIYNETVTFTSDTKNATLTSNITKQYMNYKNFIIGDNITELSENTFLNFINLTNITFTEVSIIGISCFENCISIVKIPSRSFDTVSEIRERAFYNCSSLRPMDMIRPVQIGSEAFAECTSLGCAFFTKATSLIQGIL